MSLDDAAKYDPVILAWEDMNEHQKRSHLAWSHGYLPTWLGGADCSLQPGCLFGPECKGDDAWVLDELLHRKLYERQRKRESELSVRLEADLDERHEDDHMEYEVGGGLRPHVHPWQELGNARSQGAEPIDMLTHYRKTTQ